MNNFVIFGAAENGLRLKRDMESDGIHINCFCDNNPDKVGNQLDGTDIVSFEQVIEKCGNTSERIEGIVIAVSEPDDIIQQIRNSAVDVQCYGLTYEYLHRNWGEFQPARDFIYTIDTNKPRLDYFEYHVSYHCNLKCKGCGHYSNVVPEEFGDLDQYRRDLDRLQTLYAGVKRIRLMGGEPLLNLRLADFCNISRQAFPDANIRVVTNGLLIPGIHAELLQAMKENFVGFDITQYPPTQAIKEKIELRCMENGVVYTMSEPITRFFNIINPAGDSDREAEFAICDSRGCHFLENGKMAVCAMPILNKKYKDMIDKRISICEKDIMDIYDESLDGFKLNQFLSQAAELCRFCDNTKKKWFDWRGNFTGLI